MMVSIVIPTYNESENIKVLLPAIDTVWRRTPVYRYEVLVVDDNSPDKTADAVRSAAKQNKHIRLLHRPQNRGLGTAYRDGIAQTHGEVIVGMDGDFNHDPSVLPSMLKALETADLVVASRFIRGSGMANSFRYWGSFLFNFLLRVGFGFPIWDNTSGYFAIRKKILTQLGMETLFDGYGEYHLRMVYRASRHGLRLTEVPVFYGKRIYGQSKSRLLIMLFTYVKTAYLLTRARK